MEPFRHAGPKRAANELPQKKEKQNSSLQIFYQVTMLHPTGPVCSKAKAGQIMQFRDLR